VSSDKKKTDKKRRPGGRVLRKRHKAKGRNPSHWLGEAHLLPPRPRSKAPRRQRGRVLALCNYCDRGHGGRLYRSRKALHAGEVLPCKRHR
jgi:hypothetical protein